MNVDDATLAPILGIVAPETRNRLTVGFRLLLAIPHFIVLGFISIAAVVVAIVGWFAALVLGRLPARMARFLTRFTLYATRVNAYAFLLTDRYPPFSFEAPEYPIQVRIEPTRLNRLAVLFRLLLAIPAEVMVAGASGGLYLIGLISWFAILFTGRMPTPLYDATAVIVRFTMRVYAYMFLITGVYPWGLFGDRPEHPAPFEPMPEAPSSDEPGEAAEAIEAAPAGPQPRERFVLDQSAKAWVIIALVLGILGQGANAASSFQRVAGSLAVERLDREYAELSDALDPLSARARACTTLRCIQPADAAIAGAVRDFAAAVDDIAFPARADAAVAAVLTSADVFASAFEDLAEAPSLAAYQRLARQNPLEVIGALFDQRVQELARALV